MEKIKGYTKEEAMELVGYIVQGKAEGRTLSSLFESFGRAHGRAKGSIRNYYYALLKSDDPLAKQLLAGSGLKAECIRSFTEEETDRVLKKIVELKQEGFSVRKAICKIANGDEKLMLRLQNKYRNVAKKDPERIRDLLVSCTNAERGISELMRRRIENEIDGLYERVASGLRAENSRLKREADDLRQENKVLKELLAIAGRPQDGSAFG